MNNEIKINVPEGMEIDKENSTFECIKFKPKWIPKRGDIVCTDGPFQQIMLVNKFIRKASPKGFIIKSPVILTPYCNYFTVINNSIDECIMWAVREAYTSEKELLINKLKNKGYVYDPNDPRVIYKKEKELPKTWKEFCKNNPVKPNEYFVSTNSDIEEVRFAKTLKERIVNIDDNLLPSKEYAEAMLALCKLIQLRDCYNGEWKPDWNNGETKYAIHTRCNKLEVGTIGNVSFVLTFKTEKLRDVFLQNFKDLIEQAKLLL